MARTKEVNEMIMIKPYFMKRKEWFYFDEKEFCYKLTDKAPKEAIDSYNQFYELLKR